MGILPERKPPTHPLAHPAVQPPAHPPNHIDFVLYSEFGVSWGYMKFVRRLTKEHVVAVQCPRPNCAPHQQSLCSAVSPPLPVYVLSSPQLFPP